MATIEEKFEAAVNVIKNLPKNGSFQPSSAMMLSFYSYFKQATLGPCTQKKPPFWDIVGKAKYDAWYALGEMPKKRAMELYVDELKKIIETMSFNDNVADFVGSIGELDNVKFEDLEAIAPEVMKKARSHPDSPFNSRGNSPLHGSSANGLSNGEVDGHSDVFLSQNGHGSVVDLSDDEYIDTVEDTVEVPSRTKRAHSNNNSNTGGRSESSFEITREHLNYPATNPVVLQQILLAVERMNADVSIVSARLNTVEQLVAELRTTQSQLNQKITRPNTSKYPHWWPFANISPTWFAFLILWPFVAQRVSRMLQRKK